MSIIVCWICVRLCSSLVNISIFFLIMYLGWVAIGLIDGKWDGSGLFKHWHSLACFLLYPVGERHMSTSYPLVHVCIGWSIFTLEGRILGRKGLAFMTDTMTVMYFRLA